MAFGLPGHDDGVEGHQVVDQRRVLHTQRAAFGVFRHFGAQRRVVFREGMVPLDLETRLPHPGDAVKEDRLLHGGHQGVADPPEHGVVRPDHEGILAVPREAPDVMQCVGGKIDPVAVPGLNGRVDAPGFRFHVVRGDDGLAAHGVFAVPVYPEHRMEDLVGRVGVHRGDDFRDGM